MIGGLVIGLVVGGTAGFFVAILCMKAAQDDDKQTRRANDHRMRELDGQ